jgi:putative Ca2+/H+ antiporter (TMEM165/GDT1 family)
MMEVAVAVVELVARRPLRRILATLFVTIGLWLVLHDVEQENVRRTAESEKLFQSGVELEKAGERQAALEKQGPRDAALLLNLAATERAAGELD